MAKDVKQAGPDEWSITVSVGPAGPFHEKRPADDTGPQIWIHRPAVPTLVLGSSQLDEVVNQREIASRGVDVCRRRSGGGLVYIDPASDCWIDIIIPSTSRLFDPDIARAFHWVGSHWTRTLERYFAQMTPTTPAGQSSVSEGQTANQRQTNPPTIVMASTNQRSDASSLLCFAGISHGELTIDGRKVVGLSQRRTRSWARIQSIVTSRWDSTQIEPLIASAAMQQVGLAGLSSIPAGLPDYLPDANPVVLAEIFIAHLPVP